MAKKKRGGRRSKAAAGGGAAGGGGTAGLSNVSIAELEREMQKRRGQVTRLMSKRDRLAAQVAELDREIASLGGPGSTKSGGLGVTAAGLPRRRPRNEQSLNEALRDVLKGNTMSVTEAAEAVQAAGYQTSSANFRTIVNQTLIKDPRFKKVARGQYTA